jgi:ATP-dependent RNA helicase RhlE
VQEKSITTSFDSLGLRPELLRAIAEQGYTQPTPIQAQAIPAVVSGRDLLGAAQTGTGKTAAFALPILQRLSARNFSAIRCLVVTPTRELAAQVEQDFRTYGKHVSLRSACIFGGVGMQPQVDALRRGVDILVATPGRLLDHVQQKTVDLRQVEILVLDEADRMLDMGFIHDIRKILALLPQARQNLLFSATFPDEIRKLAASFMKDPQTVEVARRNTPAELVAQVQHPVDQQRKRELLTHLVKSNDWHQVLVFTRTKHGANRLAKQLNAAGVEADAIHGNKAQNHRTRTLKRFKDNELRVLVATDIAARGLDIEALPHVVNFDLPHVAEDYVHRIGRTGRAGAEGEACSLVSHEERPLMAAIEKLMNRKVEERAIAGFERGSAPQQQPQEREQPRRHQQPRQQQPRQQQPRQRQQQRQQHQQRRPQQQPQYQTDAYEDQIREARARLIEEGEPLPPAAAQPQQQQQRRPNGGGNGGGRPGGGQRRGRGGRGGRGGRPDQQQRHRQGGHARDSRRDAAYSQPRDYTQPKAAPARAVQVTHKTKRTLMGFVGSLLGRKPDPEKS